jgi:hypothetical protein
MQTWHRTSHHGGVGGLGRRESRTVVVTGDAVGRFAYAERDLDVLASGLRVWPCEYFSVGLRPAYGSYQ